MTRVAINGDKIRDWDSFHSEFAYAFGFPAFYGRNLDAWIDCMTSLDAPEDEMSEVHCAKGSILAIELSNSRKFKLRCPEIYDALVKCSASVNRRRLEVGETAVLELREVD